MNGAVASSVTRDARAALSIATEAPLGLRIAATTRSVSITKRIRMRYLITGDVSSTGEPMPGSVAEIFDFIVTGAGSAGCVVASRLSESSRHRVLLLEAGPRDRNPWIHILLGYAKTYVSSTVNWRFETEPQPQLGNRRLYLPRGKTLGGSSSINGMVYIRGNHADYDEWRQRGCEGWDWDSVLPFFKKAENQTRGADEFHGVGGPLHVSNQPGRFGLADAVLEACV